MMVETFLLATLRLFAGTVTCINITEGVDSEFWTELGTVCMRRA